MKNLAVVILVLVTFAVYIDKTDAECCNTFSRGFCYDCTRGTPRCGHRGCNWFGCNCGGGCRRAPWGKRAYVNRDGRCEFYGSGKRSLSDIIQLQKKHHVDSTEAFNRYDTDNNGDIDLEEFTEALKGMDITGEAEVSTHWQESDENQDGVITIDELDHDKINKTS